MSSKLFEVPFFSGTAAEAKEKLLSALQGSKTFIVFTPNTEQLMLAEDHPAFLSALQHSDLNLPDSAGVIWAGKLLKLQPFPKERVAGRQMVNLLLPELVKQRKKIFLLGGKGNIAQQAAEKLRQKYPGLEVGYSGGAIDARYETPEESQTILGEINAFSPDVLFVAYGAPTQEFWVLKHHAALTKHGVKLAMVVGGTLDILAGRLAPTPDWIASVGLEWAWRLAQQPWRFFRQLALLRFVGIVIGKKLSKKS